MGLLEALLLTLTYKRKKNKRSIQRIRKKSLDQENVIITERVRVFSRQARQYTMAYFALSQEAEQEAAQNGLGQHSQKIIEQMKKNIKCHYCVH
jgi:hypothetical protein